ncbi:MAG: hypothetical protein WDN76_11680 [Alphaproteobacteria bacterium]
MRKLLFRSAAVAAMLLLAACGAPKSSNTYGADPDLVAPHPESIPHDQDRQGGRLARWTRRPWRRRGSSSRALPIGLDHPRWLYVLPNGDILVAQAVSEAQQGGVVEAVTNAVQESAGAQGASANNIILLRDTDKDGIAENRSVFLAGLNQPFGMGLLVNSFYVATTDALLRFPYTDGQPSITAPGEKMASLAVLGRRPNGHWTRNLLIRNDGTKIYVSVGSATNHANDGMQVEQGRAAIYEISPNGSGLRTFAAACAIPWAWRGIRKPARSGRR